MKAITGMDKMKAMMAFRFFMMFLRSSTHSIAKMSPFE
jgi:hypothetical protein